MLRCKNDCMHGKMLQLQRAGSKLYKINDIPTEELYIGLMTVEQCKK